MSESKEKEKEKQDEKKTLSLSGKKGTLSLSGSASQKAKQTIARGNSAVVEVRSRKRAPAPKADDQATPIPAQGDQTERTLTEGEREARAKALELAKNAPDAEKKQRLGISRPTIQKREIPEPEENTQDAAMPDPSVAQAQAAQDRFKQNDQNEETTSYRDKLKKAAQKPTRTDNKRRGGKLTVTQVLNEEYERDRAQSLAAQKRAREKARRAAGLEQEPAKKILREVTIPETITVQELANRMAERSGDLIKSLMKMGVMATINQTIDADTAELLVDEFGHKVKRVSESDIEQGLSGIEDQDKDLKPRPPIVTIMGHVDHGKTSLLDAMRKTDVVAGEAGGITQHIGAYQIKAKSSGEKITFIDTPGHAAFTEMRSRGANVTDIVILVVSAADSIMPQTIEAINHAKAAKVPIIVAVNKIDLPEANPMKVKQDMLSHELIVEDMGGDVLCVEVSAKQKTNLDKLEEAILLQSELLELKANPDRDAEGAVIEAKMESGRGSVATVLIQRGTLKISDIFVVGSEWGKVRALLDDHGQQIKEAIPGQPVEILGLNGTPEAGDLLNVVKDEARAREIVAYRQRKRRDQTATAMAGLTFDEMLAASKNETRKELNVLIKADVHGSLEAIAGSLQKIEEENEDAAVRVLHSAVGGITESDVSLARASGAIIFGFNVRANAQAKDLAQKENVDIRYYNIIYDVIDDAKAVLSGLLDPTIREEYLGQAEIREVFNITKVGKVAGCMVTLGSVKRGSKVRLLRDDVVIHEGMLKTLKRFKDEVKDVKEGMECGMAFENYDDIKEGDVIECFDVVSEDRKID